MKLLRNLSVVGFAFLCCVAYSQPLKEQFSNNILNIEKWEVLDIAFKAKATMTSPFTLTFYADFIHENGTQQKVHGFYNGGNEWVIRFSASLEGNWNYTIGGELNKLNGKTGRVRVGRNKKDNHGGIVIQESNPQHFYYEDGTPYFLLAFECDWLYALDYHNKKETPKTNHLLQKIKENGFNHVVMNVFAYDVSWKKDERLKDYPEHEFGAPKDIFPFLGTNENPDYSSLNINFFKKFDRTISAMHDKRIVSHLMIYVWNKLVAWPDMNSKADDMYFDYVIKRYQAFPNITWDISKEALYYGRANFDYIHERIDRLRANDNYDRLLTVHSYKYCSKFPEKVDYISSQNWAHNLYDKMYAARKTHPKKPVFNIEHGGYEESPYVVFTGDYINAETCLRRNYMCLFSGVYTTYYWQGASWNVVIYNPFEQPEDFIKPKFEYFKHMNTLFTDLDFSTMKPTPWRNGSGYSLTNNKDTVLIYIHKENYGINAQFLKKEDKKRTYQWFNTLTGELTPEVTLTKAHGKFISPWSDVADAILISKVVLK